MDKNVAGLIGAVAVLAAAAPQQASAASPQTIEAVMQANSYADLLKPIPNALDLMKVSAETSRDTGSDRSTAEGGATVQTVQYYHHHHHHRYRRFRRYHHHHHHHHHHDYYR